MRKSVDQLLREREEVLSQLESVNREIRCHPDIKPKVRRIVLRLVLLKFGSILMGLSLTAWILLSVFRVWSLPTYVHVLIGVLIFAATFTCEFFADRNYKKLKFKEPLSSGQFSAL